MTVLFPLPVDLEECVPLAQEIGDLIDAALREDGGRVTGRRRWAEDERIAKAQRLALDRFGVPYRLVPVDEYRQAVMAKVTVDGPPKPYGISVRAAWLALAWESTVTTP